MIHQLRPVPQKQCIEQFFQRDIQRTVNLAKQGVTLSLNLPDMIMCPPFNVTGAGQWSL